MMKRAARRQLGKFELALVMVILAILVLVFFQFIRDIQQRAEAAQVSATIANLSSHLNISAFRHLIRHDYSRLADMQGMNPLQGLDAAGDRHTIPKVSPGVDRYSTQVAPVQVSYLGEKTGEQALDVTPGSWIFDRENACLVYYLKYGDGFYSGLPGAARIRLAVRLVYTDNNDDKRFDQGDQFSHVVLKPLEPYQWQ